MNEIFIIGKVVSKIEYKFIINSKKYFAKVEFIIELNKQEFKVKGYNNVADFCYRKLKKNNKVFVNGEIENNMIIKVKNIKIM
ncbi:MAG: single-stranded DNA-binding protein [Clostridia bacterium]